MGFDCCALIVSANVFVVFSMCCFCFIADRCRVFIASFCCAIDCDCSTKRNTSTVPKYGTPPLYQTMEHPLVPKQQNCGGGANFALQLESLGRNVPPVHRQGDQGTVWNQDLRPGCKAGFAKRREENVANTVVYCV